MVTGRESKGSGVGSHRAFSPRQGLGVFLPPIDLGGLVIMFRHRALVITLLSLAAVARGDETVHTAENYPIDFCLSYGNVCNDLLHDLQCPTKVSSSGTACKDKATYSGFDVSTRYIRGQGLLLAG